MFFLLLAYILFYFVSTLPSSIFLSLSNFPFSFLAQDLRVKRPLDNWPAHLALPMILMRESMKNSMIQSLTSKTSLEDISLYSSKAIKNSSRLSSDGSGFDCSVCGRIYKLKSSLRNHQKWECGKEPQFKCPYCVYKAKQKMHMARHMERMHKEVDLSVVKNEVGIKNEGGSETE